MWNRSRRTALVVVGLTMTACGGADDVTVSSAATAAIASDEPPSSDAGEEREVLVFRLTGPAETNVEVSQRLTTPTGVAEETTSHLIYGGPAGAVLAADVTAVELEVSVLSGGPVVVEIFTTRIGPSDPPASDFRSIRIVQRLAEAEVSADQTVTVTTP